jgi:hypothetical protein
VVDNEHASVDSMQLRKRRGKPMVQDYAADSRRGR